MMTIVDHLKHLCIDQYFQDEISNVVDSCMDLTHSDNLLDVTLSMRLMREAGYHVSAGQQTTFYIFLQNSVSGIITYRCSQLQNKIFCLP